MLPFLSQPAVAPACYVPRAPIEQSQLFNGSQTLTAAAALGGGTFACWIQRHALGMGTIVGGLAFDAADALNGSTGKYRDLSGFSLVVANADGVYVDLVQVASGVASFGSVIGSGLKAAMAEVIFLSGDAHILPTEFGALNIHGEPVPIATSFDAAEFGAKGFHLDFANPLAPGNDISGLGHHLTPSGFDAGGKDTVVSSPTNVFPTLNPLDASLSYKPTFSEGNLSAVAINNTAIRATRNIPAIGKWYWEVSGDSINGTQFGIVLASSPLNTVGAHVLGCLVYAPGLQRKYWNTGSYSFAAYGAATNTADVIGVAVDMDSQQTSFYQNGTLIGVAFGPTSDLTGIKAGETYSPFFDCGNDSMTVNFGQRPWAFAPPTGYKALCTDNLPESDIKDPAEGYAAETGVGANTLAQLDAATAHWDGEAYVEIIKRRDASEDWRVRFSDDPANAWATNNTNAKAVAPVPVAGGSYVGYRLRVGRKYGVYTAEVAHVTGTPTTVTHGLATDRNAVIATRVSAGGGDRFIFHPDLPAGDLLRLNTEANSAADGTLTGFGANAFTLAAAAPSGTYRVLVLAERNGFLSLSKYVGNGNSTDGAFAALDVLPCFTVIKDITAPANASGWLVYDAARDPTNPVGKGVHLNRLGAESSDYGLVDYVGGGIKNRNAHVDTNTSGANHIVIAIGRPIGGVCVAPATAR